MQEKSILIEGLSASDLLSLENLEGYAVAGKPIVFSVGSAQVLAEFTITKSVLEVQIAVVDQGGEGVLPALIDVIEKSALQRDLPAIEWSVFARNCAKPNPKLERVLVKTGFQIHQSAGGGEFYWQRRSTNDSLLRR